MNSESFSEIIHNMETGTLSKDSQERKRKEDIAISEADQIEQLVNHPGWLLINRQLREVRESLVKELADVNRCDTLKKVHNRQIMINAIELFLQSPKDFLNRRNLILERRNKWQNKRS